MKMVGSRRLELRTSCVSSRRSNQLSYEPVKLTLRSFVDDDRPILEMLQHGFYGYAELLGQFIGGVRHKTTDLRLGLGLHSGPHPCLSLVLSLSCSRHSYNLLPHLIWPVMASVSY